MKLLDTNFIPLKLFPEYYELQKKYKNCGLYDEKKKKKKSYNLHTTFHRKFLSFFRKYFDLCLL